MKACAHCGNETRNPKFCSRSCSASFHNLSKPKRSAIPGGRADTTGKPCAHCGEPIGKAGVKYCSPVCNGQAISRRKINAWLADPTTGTTEQGLSGAVKKYLIEQAGNKCSQCGWDAINPVTGRCPLQVDHIDGDCYNNVPENLRVLCPNCHALTPTYGALNKESGRAYRRKSN